MDDEDVQCPDCEDSDTVEHYHLFPRGRMVMYCENCGIVEVFGWTSDTKELHELNG